MRIQGETQGKCGVDKMLGKKRYFWYFRYFGILKRLRSKGYSDRGQSTFQKNGTLGGTLVLWAVLWGVSEAGEYI
jgi:hypothetical protein